MKFFRRLLLAPGLALGCSVMSQADTTAPATDAPIAQVGTTVLTQKQMQDELGTQLYDAENNLYQIKKRWVDQKAKQSLFEQAAKDAGMTVEAWKSKEIYSQIAQPTPGEIDKAVQQYFPKNAPTPDQLNQLKQYLSGQKQQAQEDAVYQQLAAKSSIQLFFPKPEAPHINVTYAADDPFKGPKNAPVTIVEFTDFQCPYCRQSQSTLTQVEDAYKGKIKLVSRMYPLPFHNRAKPAAEAAMCAKEQGKYWPYREKLFDKQQLEDADLHRYAVELKLNIDQFDKCVASNKYADRIQTDIADGQKFGVQGTPHFFINGQPISGAQPFDVFKDAIDNALAKTKS